MAKKKTRAKQKPTKTKATSHDPSLVEAESDDERELLSTLCENLGL